MSNVNTNPFDDALRESKETPAQPLDHSAGVAPEYSVTISTASQPSQISQIPQPPQILTASSVSSGASASNPSGMPIIQATPSITSENIQNADQNKDLEKQQNQSQPIQNQAPETPNFCVKLFMWLPIRYFALFAGILLFLFALIDWIVSKQDFVFAFVGFYLFVFGFIVLFIESPSFSLTRKVQLIIFYWFRLLSRMWGRGCFYIFVSFLCYIQINDDFTFSFLSGLYLIIVAILMLFFSFQSAKKYRRIFTFIAQGEDPNNIEQITNKLILKFDELDKDNDEKIGSNEIVLIAQQAGRILSNAERDAIQTFLDVNCNGWVGKEDFVNQFVNHNLNQKWL